MTLDQTTAQTIRKAAFKEASDYLDLSREELEALLAEREAPLIAELADIEQAALTGEERVARKRAIRDQRFHLERIRETWLEFNRAPDAGPRQAIG